VTRDVDMTLLTGFGGEEPYIDALLDRYTPRIPHVARFALENRVLLLRTDDGIGIDIALGTIPLEEEAVKRARDVEIEPGVHLRLCSAEDLVVPKAFAGRAIDWHDVETVVSRQGASRLDWTHILRQAEPLAEVKGDPEMIPRLRKLRGKRLTIAYSRGSTSRPRKRIAPVGLWRMR